MDCYMMCRGRAQILAEALRQMYPKQRRRINADLVRIFCTRSTGTFDEPVDTEWLEGGPVSEVAAWIDVEQLLR